MARRDDTDQAANTQGKSHASYALSRFHLQNAFHLVYRHPTLDHAALQVVVGAHFLDAHPHPADNGNERDRKDHHNRQGFFVPEDLSEHDSSSAERSY